MVERTAGAIDRTTTANQIRLVDIPAELLAAMRERLWLYTTSVFAVDGATPHYLGTATTVAIAGQDCLLTAAHVWRELRGERFALSLESDRLLVPVRKDCVEPVVFHSTESAEWGPDLALIRLPDLVGRDIRQVKAFYNVDKRRPPVGDRASFDTGLWAVLGAPAEQSVFEAKEAVLRISLLASIVRSVAERGDFDYVDLSFYHQDRPDLPNSYGGISGSGLWRLPIARSASGEISWNGDVMLEGVAFYQKFTGEQEGVIRCHGRKSIYERAFGINL